MLSKNAVSLEDAPPRMCCECKLTVNEEVSHRKAACVLRGTEDAICEYSGRLSSEDMGTILASSSKEQLNKLISMV